MLEPIGQGASGEVWRAQHVTVGSFAAVKLVGLGREDPEMLARVLTEAQAAASLQSAHVVQVFDQGREGDVAYIAMELLQGESLADRLARGPMSPLEVAKTVRDIARAVGKAHARGVIHRDLKPQNIFLTPGEAGQPVAKVLDFGIAKVLAAQGATREGVVVGTPAYMAPEQVSGQFDVDWRCDLWQLAIIAFECLTGRLPYAATTMGELFVQIASTHPAQSIRPGEVPAPFEAWFRRATEHDPNARFQSARELSDELSRAIAPSVAFEGAGGGAPAPWETDGAGDAWRRRMYGVAIGLACTAVLLMVALGVTLARPAPSDLALQGASSISSATAPGLAPPPPEPEPEPEEGPAPVASASAAPSASASTGPAGSAKAAPRPARPSHDPWGI
jgi:hypothetical protein